MLIDKCATITSIDELICSQSMKEHCWGPKEVHFLNGAVFSYSILKPFIYCVSCAWHVGSSGFGLWWVTPKKLVEAFLNFSLSGEGKVEEEKEARRKDSRIHISYNYWFKPHKIPREEHFYLRNTDLTIPLIRNSNFVSCCYPGRSTRIQAFWSWCWCISLVDVYAPNHR